MRDLEKEVEEMISGGGGRSPPPTPTMTWQARWSELPPELLSEVIERVEEREDTWPGRRDVVVCASICRSWRDITKEIVRTPEECSKITFPISLKQPGPRGDPIQCFIKRDRATGTYHLYLGLSPALQGENGKFLLAARKIKHRTKTDYLISLAADDFSRSSTAYFGKLRSNFLGTKFTVYDSQIPSETATLSNSHSSRIVPCRKVSPRIPSVNNLVATICYDLNVLRTRTPRKMLCTVHSIPSSAVYAGALSPHLPDSLGVSICKPNDPLMAAECSSTSLTEIQTLGQPLTLNNKAPRWHEQLQCWCLNFGGRVTVASIKNFQLVADVDPSQQASLPDQDSVILQFGKIGKDIFTMDYQYPLSAFQAFAICLSSFGTKPACE